MFEMETDDNTHFQMGTDQCLVKISHSFNLILSWFLLLFLNYCCHYNLVNKLSEDFSLTKLTLNENDILFYFPLLLPNLVEGASSHFQGLIDYN